MSQGRNPYAKAEKLLKEFEKSLKAAKHLNFAQIHQVLAEMYAAFSRERRRVYEELGWMPEGLELLGRSAFLGVRSRDGKQILATDFEDPWFDAQVLITHRAGIVHVPASIPSNKKLKERFAGIEQGFDLASIRPEPDDAVQPPRVEVHYLQVRSEEPLLTEAVESEIRRLGRPICFLELFGFVGIGTVTTWHPTVALGAVLWRNGTRFVPALDFAGNYFAPPLLRFFDRQGPWTHKARFPFVPN